MMMITEIYKTFLTNEELQKNIEWLVQNASPPVKYLVYKNLLKKSVKSAFMKELWENVNSDKQVKEIFSKQKPDSSWCDGGSWALKPSYTLKDGYSPFTPKYVTAIWILSILGDMGFTVEDNRIKKASDYVLSFRLDNGLFSRFVSQKDKKECKDKQLDYSCEQGMYLSTLCKIGLQNDPRIRESFRLIYDWQQKDGGWILRKHREERNWDRSCPCSTASAMYALYHSGNPVYTPYIKKALDFLLWHLSLKDPGEIKVPYYKGRNLIRDLVILSEMKMGFDRKNIKVLLEWLKKMYIPEQGFFRYSGMPVIKKLKTKREYSARVYKYHFYHLLEDDWITYYMTIIGSNLIK